MIGIRRVSEISTSLVEVERCDNLGRTFQRYKADPPIKEVYVCYRERDGRLDATRPVVFFVNQIYAVKEQRSGKRVHLKLPSNSPLCGRPLGAPGKFRDFLARWREAFDALCASEGLVKRFRLTQGCVIEKASGEFYQLRNFDKSKSWMKNSPFANIARVHRSPLRLLSLKRDTSPGI